MEENIALVSGTQKKFVKGIKKLLKKPDKAELKEDVPISKQIKKGRKKNAKGLVYLSHIPHGFYEHQMTQYFKQFGMVTNARVIRSKRTGNSKGYAFVEFREPAVAQIVADTMNNYLMGKRLIKAAFVPPEKQRFARRKYWNAQNNPTNDNRIKEKKKHNRDLDEAGDLKRAETFLSSLNKRKLKLQEMGLSYDFFTPVDVPAVLLPKLEHIINGSSTENSDEKPQKSKKNIKDVKQSTEKDNRKVKIEEVIISNKKGKKLNVKQEQTIATTKKEKIPEPIKKTNKTQKEIVHNPKVLKSQEKKMKHMSGIGVRPLEHFIEANQTNDDSDSDESIDFDSDEYKKMMVNTDDESDDESMIDDSLDEEDDIESDTSQELPSKHGRNLKGANQVKEKLKVKPKIKQVMKRKIPEKITKPARKSKFANESKKNFISIKKSK